MADSFAAFQEKQVRPGQRTSFWSPTNGTAHFESLIVDFSGDGGADGSGEQKTLSGITAQLTKLTQLLLSLDPLCDNFQSERMGHFHDSLHDIGTIISGAHFADKGSVDFERIEGKPLEVTQ